MRNRTVSIYSTPQGLDTWCVETTTDQIPTTKGYAFVQNFDYFPSWEEARDWAVYKAHGSRPQTVLSGN